MYAGFWKGGSRTSENWKRIMRIRNQSHFWIFTQIWSDFLPEIRWRAKKKGLHSNLVRFFARNQVKSKKKGLHSNLVRFFARNQVKSKKKRSSPKFGPIFCPNSGAGLKQTYKIYPLCNQSVCPTCKGGGMPQFCMLFYAKYTILVTQKGGHGPMPPPPKYAPVKN